MNNNKKRQIKKNTIEWTIDLSDSFAFLVPSDKKKHKNDFFVKKSNTKNAKNNDIVKAIILDTSKWKNKEAKVVEILTNDENQIEWMYKQVDPNFWFVDVEKDDEKIWYYVFDRNKLDALDWDKVQAFIKEFNWKKEAVITKVIERSNKPIVWTYIENKNFWFVKPDLNIFKKDIFIAWKNSRNAKTWDKVSLKITKTTQKNPEWKILEIIWKSSDRWVDILSMAIWAWARISFPKLVDIDLENFWDEIDKEDIKNRKDLRNLFTFTIDWEDAKDLDDAISIEKKENWNYDLYVHIADVSHYVEFGSHLDKEALRRWTSIYLVDKVIAMLPEKLSNWLCSLHPQVDRLALSCHIEINKTWDIVFTDVFESVINSNYRLSYAFVEKLEKSSYEKISKNEELDSDLRIFNNMDNIKKDEDTIIEKIKDSEKLRKIIASRKKELWTLDFDFPETKINLDENWKPVNIYKYTRYNSHKIIEEFMIMANEAIWKKFSKIPFLYRIHPKPDEENIEKLSKFLSLFNYSLALKEINPKDIAKVLFEIKNDSKSKLLSKMVLRSLNKAIYSPTNEGHFGLAIGFYSHFTSPIRRYPDLQIHRIRKEKINNKLDKKKISYYKNNLKDISVKCSSAEEKAEKLEYDVIDYFKCMLMQDEIWKEFEWQVSGIIEKGFFVELENTVEGFVLFSNLTWVYSFDNESMTFSWPGNMKKTIWDRLKVRLEKVDINSKKIDFDLIEFVS